MRVQIKLTDEQVDDILVEGLKSGYEINKTFPDEPNYYEIDQAFKTLLAYYMGDANYAKYAHDMAKGRKKNNAKRISDAYNGL
jgi:hypothetical protein